MSQVPEHRRILQFAIRKINQMLLVESIWEAKLRSEEATHD